LKPEDGKKRRNKITILRFRNTPRKGRHKRETKKEHEPAGSKEKTETRVWKE